jgi:hypothetical protein
VKHVKGDPVMSPDNEGIMLNLPTAGQNFAKIRRGNFLYVDKTRYLYEMVKDEGCYFLSRPRRFGKTLLLDTLAELLKGNRELFKGLWIDSSDHDFKKYPVIRLTMTGNLEGERPVERILETQLSKAATLNSIDINSLNVVKNPHPSDILQSLVTTIHQTTGEKVAILIDEYDAPVHNVLNDSDKAKKHLGVLQGFYSALKSVSDEGDTKLVFVTGVTKLVHGSGYSGFNNFEDWTFNRKYNAICGFTPDEFLSYFEDYLPDVLAWSKTEKRIPGDADLEYLKNEIIEFYDGYSWDGKNRVLKPFSINNILDTQELKPHWFYTATPRFLLEILKHTKKGIDFPETFKISDYQLNSTDIETLPPKPILFFTGYLTIQKRLIDEYGYVLKRPNKEVKLAWDNNILAFLLRQDDPNNITDLKDRIRNALEDFDATSLAKCFSDILSWCSHEGLRALEGNLNTVIFVALKVMQFTVDRELTESEGRMDLFVALKMRKAFIFEIKHENFPKNVNDLTAKQKNEWEAKTAEKLIIKALEQINHRNYAARYLSDYDFVMKAPMAIAGNTRVEIKFVDAKKDPSKEPDSPKDGTPNADS